MKVIWNLLGYVGKRYARFRVDRGFDATEVARKMGVHNSYLSLFETGSRLFDHDFISRACAVIDLPTYRLFERLCWTYNGQRLPVVSAGDHDNFAA